MDIFIIILVLAFVAGGIVYWLSIRSDRKKYKPSLYTDALTAMIRGDVATAVRNLRETVKKNSEHIDAYLHLGSLYRDENPYQAIKVHQSLTVRPNLPRPVQI
ncbi:MAG: hypothetical protein ACE5D1_00720, partial [Fidelibacterota bacterium]